MRRFDRMRLKDHFSRRQRAIAIPVADAPLPIMLVNIAIVDIAKTERGAQWLQQLT